MRIKKLHEKGLSERTMFCIQYLVLKGIIELMEPRITTMQWSEYRMQKERFYNNATLTIWSNNVDS